MSMNRLVEFKFGTEYLKRTINTTYEHYMNEKWQTPSIQQIAELHQEQFPPPKELMKIFGCTSYNLESLTKSELKNVKQWLKVYVTRVIGRNAENTGIPLSDRLVHQITLICGEIDVLESDFSFHDLAESIEEVTLFNFLTKLKL
jgi:hypothetical protein